MTMSESVADAVVTDVSLRECCVLLSFRVFDLVSASFEFRFCACVLSWVEILDSIRFHRTSTRSNLVYRHESEASVYRVLQSSIGDACQEN